MKKGLGLGIDLGTTHCALAKVALEEPASRPEIVALEQLVGPAEIARSPLLPSFLYVAAEGEPPLALPWDEGRRYAVGSYARARSAEVPGRVVASAKSWLCHPTLDRRSGILPLEAAPDVEKISPVEASWRYLEHVAETFDALHGEARGSDAGRLSDATVVLTVPASFDASARELTVEAALAAGFGELTLLEEPQAALYSWLDGAGDAWRKALVPGDVVLVIDVGGGTSDFSAIVATEAGGELGLERVAVGDHILLGGDNMDLALAHTVAAELRGAGTELDGWQLAGLTHACRGGKERLFDEPSLARVSVVVPSRGKKLVGGSIRAELTRADVERIVIDGFFPAVDADALPQARSRAALTRFGLPYAADAAVTRHLAGFLARHAGAAGGGGALLRPTKLLFNGGVMKSHRVRERVRDTLNAWLRRDGAREATELGGVDLDLAVARGAASYARVKQGQGIRIRGGTARAYYVGVESAVPAVPGIEPPITLVCVAPFGIEEGSPALELGLESLALAVVVGEAVRFRFYSSSVRRDDALGTTLERVRPGETEELAPIEVVLPAVGRADGELVPVVLSARVTEVGTLLLEAVPLTPKVERERWKVELSVRGDG